MKTLDERLTLLAEVVVRVGLNLQPRQELVLTAPIEAVPLVRKVAEAAYRRGASLVLPLLSDDALTLMRYQMADLEALKKAPAWLYEGLARAYREGAARLGIRGGDPRLLEGVPPEKIAVAQEAQAEAYRPALEAISQFVTNWTLVPFAHPAWARRLFPELPEEEAVNRLWEALFQVTRVDQEDPVAAWEAHNRRLGELVRYLNERRFHALHFRGPGTDLTVGLAEGHVWQGGAAQAQNGVVCTPNLPTEEVFTAPHRARVEGYVTSSKPLAYGGQVVEEIFARFEGGVAVEVRAKNGEAFLKALEADEGARRLGEVALVPASSPVAKTGLLFLETLLDENAASHLAFGQSYAENVPGSPEEQVQRGGNQSKIHIDWMIGSPDTDVDGLYEDGTRVALMRRGEWVI
ncbi:aminopeptidase [Thermus filiformis]|uniref:Peptidase M29 n=1 Tax=Thermus filiformis TaxID=276 RepID=A0A0A2XC72_THEFI|nr:aminopeptidase [Thermus filiformis]KGQ22764.2 peptidase M29 [Thermus filiformis]